MIPSGTVVRPGSLPTPTWRHERVPCDLTEGMLLVDISTLVNVVQTNEHFCCCGTTHTDGPNITCANGHPIGAEQSDCISPHFVALYADRVEITLPEWGLPR